MTTTRAQALASYLKIDESEIEASKYDSNIFIASGCEMLVLSDEEATERAREYILDSLWAFNSEFLARYIECDDERALISSLKIIQEKLCESANPVIKAMLGEKLEEVIDDAIEEDGRGHFMSSYDGIEHESLGYYIYKIG